MSDGLWINGKFVLTSTIEKMIQLHKAQDKENQKLRAENAELKVQLSEKACVMCNYLERSDCKNEKAALKAMVNILRNTIETTKDKISFEYESYTDVQEALSEALALTEQQSLHDHCAKCTKSERSERDMALAEKVREVCAKMSSGHCGIDGSERLTKAIRNLDLTAITRGEGEEE